MNASMPKVSVCVTTYNHEKYIEPCLLSILAQETDFDFELVVGDDCSTDKTGEILTRLAGEHPERLRVIRHAANLGPTGNFLFVHNAARGEYVAILDGDDLALPGKLAAQARFLDDEPALAACGHRMRIIDEAGAATGPQYPARLESPFDLGKAIRCGMPVFASSVMYRARARTLRASDVEVFDWFILTDILRGGDAGYLSETLGAYRINHASLTGQLKSAGMLQRMIGLYERRLAELPEKRSDFYAFAFVSALACARRGIPVTEAHRRLLMASFTPFAGPHMIDAFRWALENQAALAR
jgi:glycosyltransferase involved in cell wall biosynthesis